MKNNENNDDNSTSIIKIHKSEVTGTLITRCAAAQIIRDSLKKLKKYAGIEHTIFSLLSTLKVFRYKEPDEKGYFIITKNPAAPAMPIFFLKDEVKNINILNHEYLYIDFDELIKRPVWRGMSEIDIILLLQRINNEQLLKAIGVQYHVPRALNEPPSYFLTESGEKFFYHNDSPTGYYGSDARYLIDKKEAIFQLSEIISVEEEYFSIENEEELGQRETIKKAKDNIEKPLIEIVYKQLKEEPIMPSITKKLFAKRMYEEGVKCGFYSEIQDPKKKESALSTIERKISSLGYAEKKQSLLKIV